MILNTKLRSDKSIALTAEQSKGTESEFPVGGDEVQRLQGGDAEE